MGIFDIFRLKSNNTEPLQQKDERKAECPYCNESLAKIPGAKTKCPHCGKFMFVRTRPKDNVRVVVTESEADKIDEEWSIVNDTHDSFVTEKENYAKEKEMLRKRFGGKEPSENDIKWGLLNKELVEHATNGDWGLYRNAKFQMGEILRKETKLKDALRTYFEVCYLDLNGPNNTGGINDSEFRKEFLPFDPTGGNSFIAPGIIDRIQKIIKKMESEKEIIKTDFIEYNLRIQQSLKLPLAPIDCWSKIEIEIWN